MYRKARINIGLLGGRGYGKTVFLTKLIQLADTCEDGYIQFDAGSESLQIKNEMLTNSGKLPATRVKEFSNYKFYLGKQSGEEWRIQFYDYAGELLEKINASSNSEEDGENDDIEAMIANPENRQYIKRVNDWLKTCDAIIVFVPADINESKYKDSEVRIFQQNIGKLIKITQESKRKASCPVCLAINKWDLVDGKKTVDDIIKQEPFAIFNQLLKNICHDNLFCMPVSAFGKHIKNKPDEAAPDGKPINVSELLIELVEKAEHAKAESIRESIESMSSLYGWCIFPHMVLLTKSMLDGATSPDIVESKKKLHQKYWGLVTFRGVVDLVALALVVCAIGTAGLLHSYKTWERKIAHGFSSKDMIEKMDKEIYSKHTFDFMFGRYSFLSSTKKKVRNDFEKQVVNYNNSKLDLAKKAFKREEGTIKDLKVSPDIRNARIDRLEKELNDYKDAFTDTATNQRKEVEILLVDLKNIRDLTAENYEFDRKYTDWLSIQDDYEKANEAYNILGKYTTAYFPNCEDSINAIRNSMLEIEAQKFSALKNRLYNIEDPDNEFGDKTNDYERRIERAKARCNEIVAEKERIPHSSKTEEMDKLLSKEETRIAYLNQYGPFDRDVEALLALNINEKESAAREIKKFVDDNSQIFREKRSSTFDKLEKKLANINETIYKKLIENLTAKHWEDVEELDYSNRIKNSKDKIILIEKARGLLTNDEQIALCEILERKEKDTIAKLNKYGQFDVDRKRVLGAPIERKAIEIEDFLKRYAQNDFPERNNEYEELIDIKDQLTSSFFDDLNKRLLKIDPSANWNDSIKDIKYNIKLIEDFKARIPADSDQRKECDNRIDRYKDRIQALEHDGVFDEQYTQLQLNDTGETYIREIDAFLKLNTVETYPRRASKIEQLRNTLSEREIALHSRLSSKKNLDNLTWKEQVSQLKEQIKEIDDNIVFFSQDSSYRGDLTELKVSLNKEIARIEKYGPFDERWNELQESFPVSLPSENVKKLDLFLSTNSRELYPERDKMFDDASALLKSLDDEIYTNYNKELADKFVSDNDALSWQAKELRANSRIELSNSVLKDLSLKSSHRLEVEAQLKKDRKLCDEIEKHRGYYIDFDEVVSKSDFECIPAIDSFIDKYQAVYPNPLPMYSIGVLSKKRKDVYDGYKTNLETDLSNNEDDHSSLDFEERISRANNRISSLKYFSEVTGDNKSKEIQETNNLVSDLKQQKEFTRNYTETIRIVESLSSRDAFACINSFYSKYPEDKWANKRKTEYDKLKSIESTRIQNLENALNEKLKPYINIPQPASFQDTLLSYENQERILKESLNDYLESMPIYKNIENRLINLAYSIKDYQTLCKEEEEITRFLNESNDVSKDSSDSIGVFLIGITKFERSYPTAAKDRRLSDKMNQLRGEKEKWNKVLYDKMLSALRQPETDLLNAMSSEEKDMCYEQLFSIYSTYLPYFSPDCGQYSSALIKRDNVSASSDQLKKEKIIKEALTEVKKVIEDSFSSPDIKLSEIAKFRDLVNAQGTLDNKVFESDFVYIYNMEQALVWSRTWNEIEESAKNLINKRPGVDDVKKIEAYLSDVDIIYSKVADYIYDPRSAKDANELLKEFNRIKLDLTVISKEDELYRKIDNAAAYYLQLQSPTESTLTDFNSALNEYNRSIPSNLQNHRLEIERIQNKVSARQIQIAQIEYETKAFQAESTSYSDIKTLAANYSNYPTSQNLEKFKNAYRQYIYVMSQTTGISNQDIRNLFAEHQSELKLLDQSVTNHNQAIIDLNEALTSFRNYASSTNLSNFLQKANQCMLLGIYNSNTRYAQSVTNWLSGKSVQVELTGFNFLNSGFTSPALFDVDFRATVSSARSTIRFVVNDIDTSDKHNPSLSYLRQRLSSGISQTMIIDINEDVKIVFGNYNLHNDIGSDRVSFLSILKYAMDDGEYTYSFSARSSRHEDMGYGNVYIKFSGLPCIK